ncbi:TTC28 [Symbiodinium sp. CCMP2592]|nr:TTC28 [Symbiodinium sp. CCMP2592]
MENTCPDIIRALLLSILQSADAVRKVLGQAWIAEWHVWKDLNQECAWECEDVARRLLQITASLEALPEACELASDESRLAELHRSGRRLARASGEGNNAGAGKQSGRAAVCTACREFLIHHPDERWRPRSRTISGSICNASVEEHNAAYLQSHLHAAPAVQFMLENWGVDLQADQAIRLRVFTRFDHEQLQPEELVLREAAGSEQEPRSIYLEVYCWSGNDVGGYHYDALLHEDCLENISSEAGNAGSEAREASQVGDASSEAEEACPAAEETKSSRITGDSCANARGDVVSGHVTDKELSEASMDVESSVGSESESSSSAETCLQRRQVEIDAVAVEPQRTWTTPEDASIRAAKCVAAELRRRPLLPKDNAVVSAGVKLPLCHCAFRNCNWISEVEPCTNIFSRGAGWCASSGSWRWQAGKRSSCCDSKQCLWQHLLTEHSQSLAHGADAVQMCTLYMEGLAEAEAQNVPAAGYSVDRRTFQSIACEQAQFAVRALVCCGCARVCLAGAGRASTSAYISVKELFGGMHAKAFEENWSWDTYVQRYAAQGPLKGAECITGSLWRRRLLHGPYAGQEVVCCPEDERCNGEKHNSVDWCEHCEVAICQDCFARAWTAACPQALANDNHFGFAPAFLYALRVRFIEAAAAAPLYCAMVSFYMSNRIMAIYSKQKLGGQNTRWPSVQKRKEVFDWLPCARIRPAVVLLLLSHLVAVGHPLLHDDNREELLAKLRVRLENMYPEEEAEVPLMQRKGSIPAAVRAKLEELLEAEPKSDLQEKNATPLPGGDTIGESNAEVSWNGAMFMSAMRPDVAGADRSTAVRGAVAEQAVATLGRQQSLTVKTDSRFVDQWQPRSFSCAFPWALARAVSGPDFPLKSRYRRVDTAAVLTPAAFTSLLSGRVEGNIRSDWHMVPATRRITTFWSAVCQADLQVKLPKSVAAQATHAKDVVQGVRDLYRRLQKGKWHDGNRERRVNYDTTKLGLCRNLSFMERHLLRNMQLRAQKLPGTKEIRRQIGHCLQGTRIEHGSPMFITISPSAVHNGLVARLSRYRQTDPILEPETAPWAGPEKPSMWNEDSDGSAAVLSLPPYHIRKLTAARDPHAVNLAFDVALKYILPRLLGLRCCSRCGTHACECIDGNGKTWQPSGGIFGLVAAYGGSVEYQHVGAPHFHGNVHVNSIYSRASLPEIARRIEARLLDPQAVVEYHEWVHKCTHFHEKQHEEQQEHMEQAWQNGFRDCEHDVLDTWPDILFRDAEVPARDADAKVDVAAYVKDYDAAAQEVFSRCQHHVHITERSTGLKRPLNACLSKRSKGQCKHDFPQTQRLTRRAKVICKGNCKRHGLRVRGRRSWLGSILSKRRSPWISGTASALGLFFRCNTHTCPNIRLPLVARTHDPECKSDCLGKNQQHMQRAMARAASRCTNYFTGYIQKGQGIGKKQMQRAVQNLHYLTEQVSAKEPGQQFQKAANRVFADLQFGGVVRPAAEEFRLASHADKEVLAGEFLRNFASAPFCGFTLLSLANGEERQINVQVGRKQQWEAVNILELYAYRGQQENVRYLSPWEFVKWWELQRLHAPRAKAGDLTKWTGVEVEQGVEPKPGKHFVVREQAELPLGGYVVLPAKPPMEQLRHRYILRRRAKPVVPKPTRTKMPHNECGLEKQARLLNLFFRPWCIDAADATLHVPLVQDLNRPVAAPAVARTRLQGKQTVHERSHLLAWKAYCEGHVVSEHAARMIRNVLSVAMGGSNDRDSDEENPGSNNKMDDVDTAWVTSDVVQSVLLPEERSQKKVSRTQLAVEAAAAFWDAVGDARTHQLTPGPRNRGGHMEWSVEPDADEPAAKRPRETIGWTASAGLHYGKLTIASAEAWLGELSKPRKKKLLPTAEQMRVLRRVVKRCLEEHKESKKNGAARSEPMRLLLHGVPGAGKSQTLKWLRMFLEEVCEMQHGQDFVFLAPQNTQASLLSGRTLHSFAQLGRHGAVGDPATVAPEERDVSAWFVLYQRIRWVMLDEISNAGLETVGALHLRMQSAIRKGAHSWACRVDNSPRPFGGVNLVFSGDFWQFPPVRASAVTQNPFLKHGSAVVRYLQNMFWTKSVDSLTDYLELTVEKRCEDDWLSFVLKSARHGCEEEETWCFSHGLATLNAGSWQPWDRKTSCGKAKCAALRARWQAERQTRVQRPWQEQCTDECAKCRNERRRRCIVVGCSDISPQLNEKAFASAPFIHGLNAVKYLTAQVRARQFAETESKTLLWVVARDKASEEAGVRTAEERARWLRRHDADTNGISGLLPLVQDLPVRVTATEESIFFAAKGFTGSVYKNTRGQMRGWTLSPRDAERVTSCTDAEMVLLDLPEAIFVAIPGAKWCVDQRLGVGVLPLRARNVNWNLDASGAVPVIRRGFTLAVDLAGTAHSFMGATLPAAVMDLGSMWQRPTYDSQLMGYMIASRVSRIDQMRIVQAYSPMLFSQGDLPGPRLLTQFWRGELEESQLQKAWQAATVAKGRARHHSWPDAMLLSCSSCPAASNEQAPPRHPLKCFRACGESDKTILLQGMQRRCDVCWNRQRGMAQEARMCSWCRQCATADNCSYCDVCAQKKLVCAVCTRQTGKDVRRVLTAFEPVALQRMRAQRCLQRATCLLHAQKASTQHRTCSSCGELRSQRMFSAIDWQAKNQGRLDKLVCAFCIDVTSAKPEQKLRTCPTCKSTLPRELFSVNANICRNCKKRPCQFCGRGSNVPKNQRCRSCGYPPCVGCGRARPVNGKYHVTRLPVWTCTTCLEGQAEAPPQEITDQ